jgi:nicotinamidase-related amidase
MTALVPDTALLVIDMQEAVVDGAFNVPQVIENINGVVARFRSSGAPIVWIQNEDLSDPDMTAGAPGWQVVAELNRRDEDLVVHKGYRDSFAATDLSAVLEKAGITRVVVTGAATSYCVQTTTLSAIVHGYDVTLVGDAHTGRGHLLANGERVAPELLIDLVNSQFGAMAYPERTIAVVAARDVVV